MSNLLKADFFALLKSKLMYILLIICVLSPLFTIVTDFALSKITASFADEIDEIDISTVFQARTVMFSNFSLTNNIGLIIPVFAGIFTMSDIRHGTIRNKIISGHDRTKIYLSHLIVSIAFCVAMSLISFLILCGGSLIFFKYGPAFNGAEAWNFVKCLIIGLLAFAYVASVSTFFALVTKSTPMTIIFTIVVVIVLGIISSIYSFFPEKYHFIFYLIPTFASSKVATTGELANNIFFCGLGSFIGFATIHTIGGIFLFKSKDIK